MTIKQHAGRLVNKIAAVSPETITIVRVKFRAFRNRANNPLNPFKSYKIRKFPIIFGFSTHTCDIFYQISFGHIES